jgi:hypothetical protein
VVQAANHADFTTSLFATRKERTAAPVRCDSPARRGPLQNTSLLNGAGAPLRRFATGVCGRSNLTRPIRANDHDELRLEGPLHVRSTTKLSCASNRHPPCSRVAP